MQFMCKICGQIIQDQDAQLIRPLMHDMVFVFKQYCSEHGETKLHYPESHRVFVEELRFQLFEVFKHS